MQARKKSKAGRSCRCNTSQCDDKIANKSFNTGVLCLQLNVRTLIHSILFTITALKKRLGVASLQN